MHDVLIQLLNGLVVGLSLALVASGLALEFGVLDIVNFAQGEFYMLGAFVLFFVWQATQNFWLGALAAFVVIGLLGGAVLQVMVWPLLNKSHALPLLATLGLSLVIDQEALNLFGGTTRIVTAPITAQIPFQGLNYPLYNLVIIAAGAIIMVAGYFFLRYTKYGIWLRAVADNRPMSAALGVPVPRVYFLAFALSSALAGIAGALLAPVQSVYASESSSVILNAFIVVVAGGMGNFRGAGLVALLLGEVEALGSIWFRPVEVQVFALAIVLLLLIWRARKQTAPAGGGTILARQTRLWPSGSIDPAYAVLTVVLIGLAIYPAFAPGALSERIGIYLIFGLLALSVSIVTGFARLLNIGVGAIFGIGAYAVAILTNHQIYNPFVLFAAAALSGLVVSLLFGLYANIASGIEYMMLTFLTTLAVSSIPSVATKLTGGDNGLQVKGGLQPTFGLNPLIGTHFYVFLLGVIGLCLLLVWFILSSQFGRAGQAIGRNATRAAAMGYSVGLYRVLLSLLSGFVAAIAGWLYAIDNSFVSQDLLGLNSSLNGILYALLGGTEHVILGAMVGSAAFRQLTDSLGRVTSQSTLFIGIMLLIVVYLLPGGILSLFDMLSNHIPFWTPARRTPAAAVAPSGAAMTPDSPATAETLTPSL